ncbi:LysR family transcriptional regulator [Leisingera caerulea]|uniref:LysR family transcriptional regulator n=1 Tax=Leisingera caerulea TaxID=506591 RepID=UPI0013790AE6|nr:LysR family transcriptional regulator [Leisingera caerulea]
MEISHFVRTRLKVRHLHILLALDDTLSVSRAAQRLNVAQASVSRTLSEIEDGFGVQIFDRHPRGLRRTKLGRELLLAVRKVVANIFALENLAGMVESLDYGDIVLGLHNVSLLDRMARLVTDFKHSHPKITFALRDGLLPELLEDLHYGRVDLVFGRLEPGLEQRGFGTSVLAETGMIIAAGNHIPPPPADVQELLGKPWILPLSGTPMREHFERFCAFHREPLPQNRIETNNGLLIAEILMQQDRYSLFPAPPSIKTSAKEGLLNFPWLRGYPYPFRTTHDKVGFVYSMSNVRTPAVEAFLASIEI